MTFNSLEYLLFFGAVLFLSWRFVGFPTLRFWILLLASYYFYFSKNYWLIFLILFTTQVDYVAALIIEKAKKERSRKITLIASLVMNLAVLGFFKYFNFCCDSFASFLHLFGIRASWVSLNILLPVGISFYTFQNMSYTIDVYRREIPAEHSWVKYSLIVAFFPHLVAGPIVRARVILPQFHQRPVLTPQNLEMGLFLFFRGLFKKVVIADFLAILVDRFFNAPLQADVLSAWLAIYGFAMEIYFDFSGYTDMAVGCAKLMGYEFPENFRRPYMASSITDFWKRWHITLSTWLRDYLYRCLGGNRHGRVMTLRNLMLTMLLGGLWHGACWTYVIWGAYHGLLLCLERVYLFWREDHPPVKDFPIGLKLIYSLVTFQLVCLSWIIFRAKNLSNINEILLSLTAFHHTAPITYGMLWVALLIIASLLFQHFSEHHDYVKDFMKIPIPLKSLIYVGMITAIAVMGSANEKVFIYFRF